MPASAWWEWQPPDKVKHRFARADGQPIWFAGIWETCTTLDDGELRSFTIMTGPSDGHLAEYHDRAPVILEPEDWSVWLDPATDARNLMARSGPRGSGRSARPDAGAHVDQANWRPRPLRLDRGVL